MPIWLLPFLEKLALSLALTILQKTGVINSIEATGIKAGTHVIAAVSNLKTENTYPPDKLTGLTQGDTE